ncbi:MAG: HAMP domain-containing histidine kinase [Anaerolineae bacterium]|nr:HAMP domain-containing histidine kinase [Anaerolineae bacterium]
MLQGPPGEILTFISSNRVEIQFPSDGCPANYHRLEIRDQHDTLLGKVTVWKSRDSGSVWQNYPVGWVRCWGNVAELQAKLRAAPIDLVRVINTGETSWKARRFDQLLAYHTRLLHKWGLPRSDLSGRTAIPPLADPRLIPLLDGIMDSVVNRMGYRGAMLATYEVDKNGSQELALRLFKVRDGIEWMMEWGQELMGTSVLGYSLSINEDPDHIGVKAIQKALQGEPKAYAITRNLFDLWGFFLPKDRLFILLIQFMLGMISMINIPLIAINERGERELIGNMFAGHNKLGFTERDITTFQAFVTQASLAIQNARLHQIAEERTDEIGRLLHIAETSLTETKRLAEENARLASEAEKRAIEAETVARLADFGSKMTHRMVNEIGLVRLRMQRLIGRAKREGQNNLADLEKAYANIETALSLIEEMKRPFRTLEIKPTEINEAIAEGLQEIQLPPHITLEQGPELKTLPKVKADQNLSEVFRVLIKNAYEAMGDSEGQIRLTGRSAGRKCVELFIADTGPGIPSEIQSRLFQLFYTTKEAKGAEGTGLGLWWVRTYLHRLGGKIEIDNSNGQGATFKVTLPVGADEGSD